MNHLYSLRTKIEKKGNKITSHIKTSHPHNVSVSFRRDFLQLFAHDSLSRKWAINFQFFVNITCCIALLRFMFSEEVFVVFIVSINS